jgi:hypothetical protein
MKRLALFTLALLFAACRGQNGTPARGDGGADGGGNLPDAHIIHPGDAGISDAIPTPTLTAVQPSTGSEAGGTRVVLHGTGFVDPAQVVFGSAQATSVVVLDNTTIAATTPANPPGFVTVQATTPGGTAKLPDGFRYHKELSLLGIAPARIPETGGTELSITGKGFDADTIVLLDRKPLRGLQLIDDQHITGYAPSLQPGRPDVFVFHKDAEVRRNDLLVVYAVPRPTAVLPGYGPTTASSMQALGGTGFEGAQSVTLGSNLAPNLALVSGSQLTFDAPPIAEGVYDVTVKNADATGTLHGGYIAYDPSRPGFSILGVVPGAASSGGGDSVTIVGYGIPNDAKVKIGGVSVPGVMVHAPHAIVLSVPAGLPVGVQPVQVTSTMLGMSAMSPTGLRIYAPITVASIAPAMGPASGGTMVTITGTGFVSGATARIGDVPLANVTLVSATQITGTTVAGAYGPQDVVVETADTHGTLSKGFFFTDTFEVVRIDPVEGSVAGNTYVSVLGRGFDGPVSVSFGGIPGHGAVLENGSVIGVRTASASAGTVDVDIMTGMNHVTLPLAFTFYDPTLITGGAWGGPIEGSVNVAVLMLLPNGSSVPVPGMVVQLGYDADLRYTALTDQNGLATVSAPEVMGPQTVTVGQNQFEFVTFMNIEARNLTVFTSAYPSVMPPNAPVQPCPSGGATPPIVTGNVYRFKSSIDPVTHPGFVPVAIITYSQQDVFNANPPDPPGLVPSQTDQVTMDGGRFAISVLRAGTVAVYAILGIFNPSTQQFIPEKLGIARQIPVAPNHITSSVAISLDIDMNQTLDVRLADPPQQNPGPSINLLEAYLNLKSEGVIHLDQTALAANDLQLTEVPAISASDFFYLGGSFTNNMMSLGPPFSISMLEGGQPFDHGLDFGPFLQMPENSDPKPGEVVRGGRLSWAQGGIKPDITSINVVDVGNAGGCCCADNNMDGMCEANEPKMCGSLPQQFNRWSVYGPGGLDAYVMPKMPAPLRAFDYPQTYTWEVQQALAPRFSYSEFVFYNQFTPYYWESWSVWFNQLVVKEETN